MRVVVRGRGDGDRRREIVITRYGRPVSRLVPYREKPKSIFGIDRHIIQVRDDIVSPHACGVVPRYGRIRRGTLLTLLDTHVILWIRSGDQRLGQRTRQEVDRPWREDTDGIIWVAAGPPCRHEFLPVEVAGGSVLELASFSIACMVVVC